MGLVNRMNHRVKKLGIFDVKLAQMAAMFVTLIIVKLLPEVMTISMWWFVGLLTLCEIKPLYAFWVK